MSESVGPAESRALMTSLAGVKPDAATACGQWTAHDVVAHLAAGAQETAELIEDMLAGRPPRATRSFDEREAPFAALPDAELREVMVEASRRKIAATDALAARGPDASVEFTGRPFTAGQLRTHARSEAALHRWDIVGDDDTGDGLLAQPELTRHAVDVLNTLPMLFESPGARAERGKLVDARVVLRSPDQPDVVLIADPHGPTRFELCADGPATGEVLITTDAVNRLLTLWGRRSARRTVTITADPALWSTVATTLWPDAVTWPSPHDGTTSTLPTASARQGTRT